VFVGGIHFIRPITVGAVVEMVAQVIHTGRTSLQIAIDIFAGDPRSTEMPRCGHCVIVFVSLDANGKPTPVPPWVPETPRDQQLERYALRLSDMRKSMEADMAETLRLESTAD
jgi:acyl-CoA hydrolase